MFYAPGIIFGGIEGVGSRFHTLRTPTHFRRYRGHRVPFSCFVLPDSFSTVPSVSGPIFMFCAAGLIFGRTEGVRSRFHVFRSLTVFWRCRGSRVPFSFFALPYTFSAVPRASGPVFMFCTLRLIVGRTEGVGSYFHVLCSLTRFWQYEGCRVPFSCFARPGTFLTVRRTSGLDFMFCAPGLVFCGTEGVGSRSLILRSRTRFRRYRGRPIPFSSFPLHDMFFTVRRASGPVFKFFAS
jgi:hypothetical protein